VTVPENRAKPSGAKVRLAVAIIKSDDATPAEPILYLSGGPGGPSLQGEMYGFGALSISGAFLDKHDIVFYDQRGTGLSQPNLFCDELLDFTIEVLKERLTPDEAATENHQRLIACHDRLAAEGVDFRQYSSATSADDIADVMTALDFDTFDLYGISYGTRLALTVMRDHPERVRAAVIDSVVPPNVEDGLTNARTFMRSIEVLAAGCEADPECNAAYPDVEGELWKLVAKANASPFEITIKDREGNPVTIFIDGNAILQGAFSAFYSTDLLRLLPFAANEIANNNTSLLTSLAQQLVFSFSGIARAMQTAVECNENTPFYTNAKLQEELAGVRPEVIAAGIGITTDAGLQQALEECDEFGTSGAPAVENEAVVSDIPTLVFSGQYDPITPPEWGKLAASTLSTSYFFEFPATGHGVILAQVNCALPIVRAFFDDPQTQPDGRCVGQIPPPDFLVSSAAASPTATPASGVIGAPNTGQGKGDADAPAAVGLMLAGGALMVLGALRRRA
jgi:pimeloyl-ACP methyl ester carboxylesterase